MISESDPGLDDISKLRCFKNLETCRISMFSGDQWSMRECLVYEEQTFKEIVGWGMWN